MINECLNQFERGYIEGLIFCENLIAYEDKHYIEGVLNFFYKYHSGRYDKTIEVLKAYHEGIMEAYDINN